MANFVDISGQPAIFEPPINRRQRAINQGLSNIIGGFEGLQKQEENKRLRALQAQELERKTAQQDLANRRQLAQLGIQAEKAGLGFDPSVFVSPQQPAGQPGGISTILSRPQAPIIQAPITQVPGADVPGVQAIPQAPIEQVVPEAQAISQPQAAAQQPSGIGRLGLTRRKGIVSAAEGKKLDREQRKQNKINDDFIKLGNIAINPSSRRRFGRLQGNIDVADAAKTLTSSIGVPEGKFANPKESHAQKVKRLDNMTAQQKSELVKVLDRLLSQGAPTESGQAHLLPTSLQGDLQKIIQRLVGAPTGQKEGKLIAGILDTIEREREFNAKRQKEALGRLGVAFSHLKDAAPERFNAIIQGEPLTFTPGEEGQFVQLDEPSPGGLQIPGVNDAQAAAPGGQIGPSGLTPDQRKQRILELRQKAGQ